MLQRLRGYDQVERAIGEGQRRVRIELDRLGVRQPRPCTLERHAPRRRRASASRRVSSSTRPRRRSPGRGRAGPARAMPAMRTAQAAERGPRARAPTARRRSGWPCGHHAAMALRVLAVAQAAEPGGAERALLRLGPGAGGRGSRARARGPRARVESRTPRARSACASTSYRSDRCGAAGWRALWPGGRASRRLAGGMQPRRRVAERRRPAAARARARRDAGAAAPARPSRPSPASVAPAELLAARPVRGMRVRTRWRAQPRPCGAPQERLRTLPVPVEAVEPAPRPPWADGRPVVGFVGRIEPRKGVLDLLTAARMLVTRMPETRVVIVSGPELEPDRGYEEARASRKRPRARRARRRDRARRRRARADAVVRRPLRAVARRAVRDGRGRGARRRHARGGHRLGRDARVRHAGPQRRGGAARDSRRRSPPRSRRSWARPRRWPTQRARTRRASPPPHAARRDGGAPAGDRGAMKVALDLRVLEEPALAERGIGRYAGELAAALAAEGATVAELRGLRRPWAPRRVAELWDHALLARDARDAGADLLHSPSIDHATVRPGMPYVVTLHDLVPLKQPRRYLRTGLKHRLRYEAVKRASRVIVPSRAVADDARRLLGLDDDRRRAGGARRHVPAGHRAARATCSAAAAGALPPMGRRARPARPEEADRARSRRAPPPATVRRSSSSAATTQRPARLGVRGPRRPHRPRERRGARRALLGGRRAGASLRRGGIRADAARGAGVRHARRGVRDPGARRDPWPTTRASGSSRPATSTRCWRPRRRSAGHEAASSGSRTWADVARDTLAVYERAAGSQR